MLTELRTMPIPNPKTQKIVAQIWVLVCSVKKMMSKAVLTVVRVKPSQIAQRKRPVRVIRAAMTADEGTSVIVAGRMESQKLSITTITTHHHHDDEKSQGGVFDLVVVGVRVCMFLVML